jgi:2-haloacid dehalogenase
MRPSVIVFDVNETLADLSPVAARFVEVGAPASLAGLWFASVLRDGFALTVAGESKPFVDVGAALLEEMLVAEQLNRPKEVAVEHVLGVLDQLEPHPDVPRAVRDLSERGLRLVTLSNGSVPIAEQLLIGADLRTEFEQVLSVDDAGAWKPHARAYAYAAGVCGVQPAEMLMVAVHPWDVDGAARAGLQTAWVNRSERPYPGVFTKPDHEVASLEGLVERLG